MYDGFATSTRNVRFDVRRAKGRLFFLDFILPVLKTQRLLGFAPFYIQQGKITQGFDSSTTLYGILSYALVILLTLTAQYQIITEEIKSENVTFNAALLGYLKLLSLTQQLLGPLPFLVQRTNFQRFLNKWMIFQEEYQKLTGEEASLDKLKILRTIGMSLIPIVSIIPFFIPPLDLSVLSVVHDVTFSIFFVHELCIVLYWLLTSKAIELIANQYRSNFVKEVENGRGYTSLIEAYRLLWMNLCNITNYLAASIGATITVCLIFHVLYLILAAYRTVISVPELLRNSQPWSILPILIDLLFHLAVILFFCNFGQNVVKYCTNNMLDTILSIKEQSQYRNYDEARVNIFLYTINEYEPLVSVCGFYEINRSLFGGVVSILLTYMIVIIQLKDSI